MNLAEQLYQTLKTQLTNRGIHFVTAPADTIPEADFYTETGRETPSWATTAGADYLMKGSLTLFGDSFSLDLSLTPILSPESTRHFFAEGKSLENMAGAARTITENVCTTVFHRHRIADVIIRGNQRLEADAIKRVIQTKPGDIYAREKLSADLKAVYDMGYFENIRIEKKETPAGKTILFIVQERPTLRNILINNNKLYSDEKIEEELALDRGAIINIVEINKSIKNVELMYREKNYHNIQISYNILPAENNQADLEVTIERGEKFLIKEIVFEGNDSSPPRKGWFSWLPGIGEKPLTSDDRLRDIIQTSEKGWFSWLTSSGNLKMDQLRQDVGRLASHYHNNGYIDAKIAEPQIDTRGKWIYITFKIEEGQRFRVGEVSVTGDDLLQSESALKKILQLPETEYLNRFLMRQDVLALTNLYSDQGYFYADVVPRTTRNPEELTVDVNYEITKGGLVYFNKIIITGNTKTRDKVIRRELEVYEQEQFSGKQMKKSIYNLYRLDYFEPSQIKVDTVETDRKNFIDLKIDVTEKATGTLSFGGGYSSTENLFAMASISQRNLFGRGQELQLQAELGGTSSQYRINFTEPWLFDIPLTAGFDLYKWEVDYDTYDKEATGGGLRFGYPIFEDTRLFLSNTYEENEISNVDYTANIIAGTYDTSSVAVSLLYDTRNRRINPTKGGKQQITIEKAGGFLGGDVSYTKYTAETGWYIPLFWKTVGLIHAEGGYIRENSGGYLPDYETFYLGGINSLRGFDWRDISIKEDTDGDGIIDTERGGNKYIQFNLEFIVPLLGEEIGLVGLVFMDAGNVYDKDEGIKSGTLRESAGFGVRWNSPMGPIRLERGYILDPQDDESSSGRWEFTMGAAF